MLFVAANFFPVALIISDWQYGRHNGSHGVATVALQRMAHKLNYCLACLPTRYRHMRRGRLEKWQSPGRRYVHLGSICSCLQALIRNYLWWCCQDGGPVCQHAFLSARIIQTLTRARTHGNARTFIRRHTHACTQTQAHIHRPTPIHIQAHTSTYNYTNRNHIHTSTYPCTVHTHTQTHTRKHAHTHTHPRIPHTHVSMCVCVYACGCLRVRVYVCVCPHICACVYKCWCVCAWVRAGGCASISVD